MTEVPESLRRIADGLGFSVVSIPSTASVSCDLAVRFLVGEMAEQRLLPSEAVEGATTQILKRESLGSTGIGRGYAMPHTIYPLVNGLVGICGCSETGIPWESLDGRDVQFICLMIAAIDRPGDHLRALEQVSRLSRS